MIYCYSTDDGETLRKSFPMGEAPKEVTLEDGRVAKRDYRAEHVGVPASKGWPLECWASGVNAEDADKLRQCLAERGVPTEVTEDGNPIYRDAAHRKKALKARGLFDRLAYY